MDHKVSLYFSDTIEKSFLELKKSGFDISIPSNWKEQIKRYVKC